MKLIRTLRTHWKKSAFLAGLSAGGTLYGYNRVKENLLLREYCLKLEHHGHAQVPSDYPIKQIVVFLNPSSNNGKAAKTFNKFAVPLLSVSGINFVIVPTSYEGHVSSLLKYLPEKTEALVVAGGDGMLQDTITSLLRNTKHRDLPLGFIPLGTNNTFTTRYLGNQDSLSHVDQICMSVMNIVEGNVKPVSLMEIRPLNGNTIFAASYFTWGAVKGALDTIPKFWWTGGLKTICGILRYSINSAWPNNIRAEVNGRVVDLANMTVTVAPEGLRRHDHPPLRQRLDFIRETGLKLQGSRHSGLLQKLALCEGPREEHLEEITIAPLTLGQFYIDGEPVDCRTVKIRHLSDSLKMFVPFDAITPPTLKVLPNVPRSISKFILSASSYFGINICKLKKSFT